MTTSTQEDIYSDVNGISDIHKIGRLIRQDMDKARSREQVTELKKRSDYLCTLTFSPAWQKRFGGKSERLLVAAKEENERSVRKANRIGRDKGWDVEYHAWGSGQ